MSTFKNVDTIFVGIPTWHNNPFLINLTKSISFRADLLGSPWFWECWKIFRNPAYEAKLATPFSGATGRVEGAGGRVPPETSEREISTDLPGKKRQGKKGKGVKIEKNRREIATGRWKSYKICFSLFKTTKISFGSTKMEIFYQEKSISRREKIRKNDFAPSEKFSCYTPDSI